MLLPALPGEQAVGSCVRLGDVQKASGGAWRRQACAGEVAGSLLARTVAMASLWITAGRAEGDGVAVDSHRLTARDGGTARLQGRWRWREDGDGCGIDDLGSRRQGTSASLRRGWMSYRSLVAVAPTKHRE
jgi:hypothetical protein